jgi:hypothetical protein
MKESLLLILSKHYNTEYISLYDILEMIQIANDTNRTLDEVLKEKEINIKYFRSIYNRLEAERPDIFDLINKGEKESIQRLKIYSSLKNNNIHSYGLFKNRYKRTPEEVLELFEDTELFDEVFGMLSSWYDFMPKDNKKKTKENNFKKEI